MYMHSNVDMADKYIGGEWLVFIVGITKTIGIILIGSLCKATPGKKTNRIWWTCIGIMRHLFPGIIDTKQTVKRWYIVNVDLGSVFLVI